MLHMNAGVVTILFASSICISCDILLRNGRNGGHRCKGNQEIYQILYLLISRLGKKHEIVRDNAEETFGVSVCG